MESGSACDSPKGGVVNCITELQEFKDRNVYSTSGPLTSDRTPVRSFQNEGTLVLPLSRCWPQCWLIPDVSWLWKASPIPLTSCCAKLCVFSSFRILPHKSAGLTSPLWEQLSSAFPPIRHLVSGNGLLRLGNNTGLQGAKSKRSSPLYSRVFLLEAEPKGGIKGLSFRKSQINPWCSTQAPFIEFGYQSHSISMGFGNK